MHVQSDIKISGAESEQRPWVRSETGIICTVHPIQPITVCRTVFSLIIVASYSGKKLLFCTLHTKLSHIKPYSVIGI